MSKENSTLFKVLLYTYGGNNGRVVATEQTREKLADLVVDNIVPRILEEKVQDNGEHSLPKHALDSNGKSSIKQGHEKL